MIRSDKDIAIIGMSIKFPEANSKDEFWENLCSGKESITYFEDKDLINSGVSPTLINNPKFVKALPLIKDIDMFDANFFGYTPREAALIDPQNRLFLECSWEALEDSGYSTDHYDGNIGVFVGNNWSSYLIRNLAHLLKESMQVENEVYYIYQTCSDYLATNISYKLNLKGSSIGIQTWCTTALSAIHMACQNLRTGSCDMALAGAVHIRIPQNGYFYQEGGHDSADGHCRSFDIDAQGTVPGNGMGAIILKKLDKAILDGDNIYAVIKGTCVNNDGAPVQKLSYQGITVNGQVQAIKQALIDADLKPNNISYVETSGGATILSDRSELSALKKGYNLEDKKGFLTIGSVQPNIGHLGNASGMASIAKALLILKNKKLPPNINLNKINPKIGFDDKIFKINTELTNLKEESNPYRLGINAYGIGGTNAHFILEQAPTIKVSKASERPKILTLSGKIAESLKNNANGLLEFLKSNKDFLIDDIAFTENIGRKSFDYRYSFVFNTTTELLEDLYRFCENDENVNPLSEERHVVFVLGDINYKNLIENIHELFRLEPFFNSCFVECKDIIFKNFGIDIVNKHIRSSKNSDMNDALEKNLLLFAYQYSLIKLFVNIDIKPNVILSNGVGELVILCLKGFINLEQAILLIINYGKEDVLNSDQLSLIDDKKYDSVSLNPDFNNTKYFSSAKGDWIEDNFVFSKDFSSIILGNLNVFDTHRTLLQKENTIINFGLTAISKEGSTINDSPRIIHTYYTSISKLWESGVNISWNKYYKHEERRRVSLPTYAFSRKRYWIDPPLEIDKSLSSGNTSNDVIKLNNFIADKNENQDEVQKNFEEIWKLLFGIDEIKTDENFVKLGGHSLLATLMINKLKVIYPNIEIAHIDLYNYPTISQLTTYVRELLGRKDQNKNDSTFNTLCLAATSEERYKLIHDFLVDKISAALKLDKSKISDNLDFKRANIESISGQLYSDLKYILDLPLYEHEILAKATLKEFVGYVVQEYELKNGIYSSNVFEYNNEAENEKESYNVPNISKKNKRAIFLHSAPRSGSTITRLMLEGHSSLFCPPEMRLLAYTSLRSWEKNIPRHTKYHGGVLRSFRELLGLDQNKAADYLDSLISQDYSSQEVYRLIQDQLGERILVDKCPDNASFMETLERSEHYFEKPLYIHLVRHPYSVIESIVRIRLYANYTEKITNPFIAAENDWYKRNNNLLNFFNTIDKDRYILVRYEDIIKNSKETMTKISNFLGLKFEEQMLKPYEGKRMIDGDGDPNIVNHEALDPNLADAWEKIKLPIKLSERTQLLAQKFNYQLPNDSLHLQSGEINAYEKVSQKMINDEIDNLKNLSNEELDEMLKNFKNK